MRDGSTSVGFFNVGDSVRVVSQVYHKSSKGESFSSKDMEGKIVDIWEKCEVDPHCCCAELAFDAPIKVSLSGEDIRRITGEMEFVAQFANDELEKL